MTTLREFIEEANKTKNELKDKPVYIVAENGMLLEPKIKFQLDENASGLDLDKENVESIIITWE
ncbi:MAG: hypothetical protein ACOC1O_00590 [bacterium]